MDRLYFDELGRIQTITQTTTGVEAVGPAVTGENIEAKYSPEGIDISQYTEKTVYGLDVCDVHIASKGSTNISNMHLADSWAKWKGIDGGKGGRAVLTVYYSSDGGATTKVITESPACVDGYFLKMEGTGGWGNYSGVAHCFIDLNAGTDNTVTLLGGAGFNPTKIEISLLPENAG